jgi:hypothetical protein
MKPGTRMDVTATSLKIVELANDEITGKSRDSALRTEK